MKLKEQVKELKIGMDGALKAGYILGKVPCGYKKNGKNLEVDPISSILDVVIL